MDSNRPLMKRVFVGLLMVSAVCVLAHAQELEMPSESGMTWWQIIRSGGVIMVILGVLSIFAMALIITFFLTLRPTREMPQTLVLRAKSLIEGGDVRACWQLCQEREELLAKILRAGLQAAGKDRFVVIEAMQSEGARLTAGLSQRVSYLWNVATIAPLLGILGTVLGMIQAFNGIAFASGSVKPIVLAGGISQALVTTAAGLVIAIPVMGFYFFFRGRVNKIAAALEGVSSQFIEPIAAAKGKP